MDSTGHHTILSSDGMLDTWQQGNVDNVDASYPLSIFIYVPEHTSYIKDARLRFKLLPFRSYSKGTASGGATSKTTSDGGGVSTTTVSGGSVSKSTLSGGGRTVTSEVQRLLPGESNDQTVGNGEHNHGIANGTQLLTAGGGSVSWSSHNGHAHSTYNHGHYVEIPEHSHSFSVPEHTHNYSVPEHSHSFSIPSHSHDQIHGIFESSVASGVSVIINGVDRTTALGGKFNSDKSNLDITKYLLVNQWNEIKLTSNQLGRIDATVFVQAFIRM
ncbi:hypothetical protein [Schinkia azotoformans]|uniref:hypothetical protein n=1 Tax=Schinkia azotoformans TaxID=1454 RepID=UPI002DBA7554|nr:hypothetical protein [Schinkia azotoformans]MEC1772818.1 hypothetical protein [Schinkia azotoformans]MED4367463.1 hypothetical protein [Schinkia azotoformans]